MKDYEKPVVEIIEFEYDIQAENSAEGNIDVEDGGHIEKILNFYRLNSFLHNSVRCDKHNRRSRRDIFYDVGGSSIRKKTETSQQGYDSLLV